MEQHPEHAHRTRTTQHGQSTHATYDRLSRRRPSCSAETAHRHDPEGGPASRSLGWADRHAHGVAQGWGRRGGLDRHGDDRRRAARLLHDGRGRPGDGEERSVHPRLVHDAALEVERVAGVGGVDDVEQQRGQEVERGEGHDEGESHVDAEQDGPVRRRGGQGRGHECGGEAGHQTREHKRAEVQHEAADLVDDINRQRIPREDGGDLACRGAEGGGRHGVVRDGELVEELDECDDVTQAAARHHHEQVARAHALPCDGVEELAHAQHERRVAERAKGGGQAEREATPGRVARDLATDLARPSLDLVTALARRPSGEVVARAEVPAGRHEGDGEVAKREGEHR
mmetsp:Transcript_36781/g.88301  ORF Transcript_36781/g.88301 Transcript_36781/m.88301 type:complete len:343 (+) Transcript_36781:48-1076(+)